MHRRSAFALLPYRNTFGSPRPPELAALRLPPAPMPARDAGRPLKAWRYVGVFGPELMLCAGSVRIGPARQSFWAVWDRSRRRLYERTRFGRGRLALEPGRIAIRERGVQVDILLDELAGIETVAASGASYAWTRKQGGIDARGAVTLDGERRTIAARAVVDDTAAYYKRHTAWRWSAGVGRSNDGHAVAWNLVTGVNDAPRASERTVWIDGVPHEAPPVAFAPDLAGVADLRFVPEAERSRTDNLLLVRSSYHQPFGTFSGRLPDGPSLAEGYGVMEAHDAWW